MLTTLTLAMLLWSPQPQCSGPDCYGAGALPYPYGERYQSCTQRVYGCISRSTCFDSLYPACPCPLGVSAPGADFWADQMHRPTTAYAPAVTPPATTTAPNPAPAPPPTPETAPAPAPGPDASSSSAPPAGIIAPLP